jgi:two-component system sensor histidine kinase/response regulator
MDSNNLGQPRLLVVDDLPDNFDLIEGLLFRENYELHYTGNPHKVIDRLIQGRFDLVLLDVMMPDLDGIELCKRIRNCPDIGYVPIIMVTALGSKTDLSKCLEAGADDFIAKPVSGAELRARVKSMLRIKKQHDHIQSMLNLRSEMTNAIVHDLRNPITAILLASSGLKAMSLPEPAVKKNNRIISATERLRNLVDDMLILSKLEAGKLTLQKELIDVGNLVTRVIDDLQPIAQIKHIGLTAQLQPDIYVTADPQLLRRTIDNLVSNGIKFSPYHSEIVIHTRKDAEYVWIAVADNGSGVPPAKREIIWQKFESMQIARDVPAIGLGLAFCKTVVSAHGGKIELHDNQPTGSIFMIALPHAFQASP